MACCTWAFYKQTNQPKHTSLHTLQPNKLTKHKLSQTLDKKWATTTSCATLSPRSKVRAHWGQIEAAPTKCTMQDEWYVDRQHFSVVFPVSPS